MPNVSKDSERSYPEFQPLPKYYSASRTLRNQAEKQRRDKLNYYVSELASLVPFVQNAQKKVDKTSVLRLAASYIRFNQILKQSSPKKWSSSINLSNNTSNALLKVIGGFLLVLSSSGRIIFVSEAVQEIFGYSQADLLGQNLSSFLHPDDEDLVKKNLKTQESSRRSFYCRMQEKSLTRNDSGRYEIIHVAGQIKEIPRGNGTGESSSSSNPSSPSEGGHAPARVSLRRRASSSSNKQHSDIEFSDDLDENDQTEVEPYDERTQDTHMLVAIVQVVVEPLVTNLSWVESLKDEYITRHLVTDGEIVYADHRISCVLGMMPTEVNRTLAISYMHKDDILWAFLSQTMMIQNSEGSGEITYRIMAKDAKGFTTLRSKGYLEPANKDGQKVNTFICINTFVGEEDAKKEILAQRKALKPIMQSLNPEDILKSLEAQPKLKELIKAYLTREYIDHLIKTIDNVNMEGGSDDVIKMSKDFDSRGSWGTHSEGPKIQEIDLSCEASELEDVLPITPTKQVPPSHRQHPYRKRTLASHFGDEKKKRKPVTSSPVISLPPEIPGDDLLERLAGHTEGSTNSSTFSTQMSNPFATVHDNPYLECINGGYCEQTTGIPLSESVSGIRLGDPVPGIQGSYQKNHFEFSPLDSYGTCTSLLTPPTPSSLSSLPQYYPNSHSSGITNSSTMVQENTFYLNTDSICLNSNPEVRSPSSYIHAGTEMSQNFSSFPNHFTSSPSRITH